MNALDNLALQALSDAGAQCGVCGDQPGDRICPDCERCYVAYVEALRKAGWAPRIEVLREAADDCDEAGAAYTARALNEQAGGAFALMEHFQRKASEAEYAATKCDFVACEPGGEPCSTHERLMAHAEGDHELCGDECPAITYTAP